MNAVLRLRSFLAAIVLALGAAGAAYGLNVFDIIQLSDKNYSDQDIVALIDATDSAFELKAEDIPRLMEMGVSEPVIQAMIKAVPADSPSDPATAPEQGPSHAVDSAGKHTSPSGGHVPPGVMTIHRTPAQPTPMGSISVEISSEPFLEEASGGHHHRAVTLAGLRLFVLRDEGQYRDILARADAVVDRLRDAATRNGGTFHPLHVAGRDSVLFNEDDSMRTEVIVSVSRRDAFAYQKRSGRRVSSDLLAAYWSDLLTDYWTLITHRETPLRLVDLHEGEALQMLASRLQAPVENSASQFATAVKSLPKRERVHLLRLAISIPKEYVSSGRHAAESP